MPDRTFIRVPVHIDAELTAADGRHARGVVRDLSLNGLSVVTETELPLNADCALTLVLGEGSEPVRVDGSGRVVRCHEGVVALTIQAVDPESFDHLNNLVLYNAPDAAAFEAQASENADAHPTLDPSARG